eukprot:1156309-Pelagomonas_calceolata.AAC.12
MSWTGCLYTEGRCACEWRSNSSAEISIFEVEGVDEIGHLSRMQRAISNLPASFPAPMNVYLFCVNPRPLPCGCLQRQDVDNNNNHWACPACAHLNEDEKHNRESSSHSKELVRIAWEPSWEPEDTKEIWPTFLQRSVKFETHKDEPSLSIPAADLALDNLERQLEGFGREDRNNTWK